MPNQALVIGLTYPHNENGLQSIPGMAPSSTAMADLAMSSGHYDALEYLSDADGDAVTREDILGALYDMVSAAEPGDSLFFSYLGHGGSVQQNREAGEMEVDGNDERIWASDGPVYDDEIRAAIAQLPEGVNLTMVFDACHSGTMADLDTADFDANITCLSSSADWELSWVNGDGSGSSFTDQLRAVMAENPDLTLDQLKDELTARLEPMGQTVQLTCSRPELAGNSLFTPATTIDHHDLHASDMDVDPGSISDTMLDGEISLGEAAISAGEGELQLPMGHLHHDAWDWCRLRQCFGIWSSRVGT
ncbi:caspase domain-domain-containing protein [Catenaria anguillulae PL171]|uniref:Caspase domain-domain-containing protein n=1 Tax=Catenaria anguillulae PL171 TaxID=765915 RepID=A0A1Y2H4W3_9FUNG|nr:caspase domain-domain-containing protein [Catenaria anguillulae PL171]